MGRNRRILSFSSSETIAVGERLGRESFPNTIFCLFGELGSGKTTLVKGIVRGVLGLNEAEVNSPTFIYLNIYEGEKPIYHFDLYRLNGEKEFLALGFEEYFFSGGICCIEWSERIEKLIPSDAIRIHLSHFDKEARSICVLRT